MAETATAAGTPGANAAHEAIISPTDHLGFTPGDARKLAPWSQIAAYFQMLGARSPRVHTEVLGNSTEGRPFLLSVIASEETHARLDHYRDIQTHLADPRGVSARQIAGFVAEGKTIALVTCTIHATEVGATLMAMDLAHDLATKNDATTRQVLDNVILLLVPSLNPDGWDLVEQWYTKTLGTPFEGSAPPQLYQTYTGHDNNRDWFMLTQAENRLAVEKIHNVWHPQIVYDLHQMMPDGPRYFVPPFIDPYDPNVDPILSQEINVLGSTMAQALAAHGKTGVTTNVIFDAFSPSRAYQHYHGGVRILSEAASCRIATPVTIAKEDLKVGRGFDPHTPTWNHPHPWPGGEWTLADIVSYNRISTDALLLHAARYRDMWLTNFAALSQRAVERTGPPLAFVVPAGQRDPVTVAELLQVLQRGGVELTQAKTRFTADGVTYPAGSAVITLAQPYGAYAKTLLEAQKYPDLRLYPDGPPKPPYDITAHSLPLQMGVEAVAVTTAFKVDLVPASGLIAPPKGTVKGTGTAGIIIGAETNASVKLVNALLAEGIEVTRTSGPVRGGGEEFAPGAYAIAATGDTLDRLRNRCIEQGVRAAAVERVPTSARRLRQPKVGLYRPWWSSAIDEGWTRFILEDYGFLYDTLRDGDIRQGDLRGRCTCIILPAMPAKMMMEGNSATDYPPEYTGGIGELGAANLRRFVEAGGTLIALDTACEVAIKQCYLPVTNVLEGVGAQDFYSPGSMVRILLDPNHPVAYGFERESVALFVNSPAFAVHGGAAPVARYPMSNPLLSGWMLGPEKIQGQAAVVEVPVAHGHVVLIGFRTQFRAQARGTY
ncbi:MAG: M14 family metallopeptidase, partial [Thermomicrobia bacterium]|nr:M14 family metallopeptidase [Thermomicrobia bacterium]